MSKPLDDSEFFQMEEIIYKEPFNQEKEIAQKLLHEVRRLKHELDDPNYIYSGRIHRAAILCRNAEIDALRAEIQKIKSEQEAK